MKLLSCVCLSWVCIPLPLCTYVHVWGLGVQYAYSSCLPLKAKPWQIEVLSTKVMTIGVHGVHFRYPRVMLWLENHCQSLAVTILTPKFQSNSIQSYKYKNDSEILIFTMEWQHITNKFKVMTLYLHCQFHCF